MSDKRPDRLAIALAQLNAVVGDIDGNKSRALEAWGEARGKGADLVVFPELFIDGYPPEDLVLKPAFVAASKAGEARRVDAGTEINTRGARSGLRGPQSGGCQNPGR